MKSPFAIFRKHQRALMAVLTGLAMFAFVVLDSMRTDRSDVIIPILCAIVLAAIFAFLGRRSGEGMKYGVVGVVVGALIGTAFLFYNPSGPKSPVETQLGNLSQDQLHNLIVRRQNANNFLRLAMEKTMPPLDNSNPYMAQYMAQMREQQVEQFMFGFGRGVDESNDAIRGFLLDKEADEIGVLISDKAVSDYIHRATNHKLKAADFTAILKQLGLSESELFTDIRSELRAKVAAEMLVPRAAPTPEQYWEDFRKLNETRTLDVAGVPVADFVASAPEPAEDQLAIYYDRWKEVPTTVPGGLRQPRRIAVEYLQADLAEFEKEVATRPVTDAEIKKYYEAHHEEYRTGPSTSVPPLPSAPSGPTMSFPATPAGAGSGKGTSSPTPPATAPVIKTQPGAKTSSGVKPSSVPPEQRKPATPPTKEKKDAGKSGALNDRKLRDTRVAGGDAVPADTAWDEGSLQLVAYQPAAETKAAAQHSKTAGEKQAPTNSRSAAATANPVIEPDAPPLPEAPHARTMGQAKPGSPSGHAPQAPATPASGAKSSKPAAPPAEFRPLDDTLKHEIHDVIVRTRAQEVMKARIQTAYEFLLSLRDQVLPAELDAPPKVNAEGRAKIVSDYAAKNKLKYVVTPPLSAEELSESFEKYLIAAAGEPVEDPFEERTPPSVIQLLFSSLPEQTFQPGIVDDRDAHRFAYWKVEDIADHVPTLTEAGVRQLAIRNWKIEQFAEKKAKERADDLADLVRKSKQRMSEALAGQTVTKKEKGAPIVVVPTPPFTWFSVPSAAPSGLVPDTRPRLSDISGVKEADDAFMRAVFDEMKVGDVRVVPNHDRSILYVVKIMTRHPADAAEMAGFRARFMKENLFGGMSFLGGTSTYAYLNMPQQNQLMMDWDQRLNVKYGVHINIDEERRPARQRRRSAG